MTHFVSPCSSFFFDSNELFSPCCYHMVFHECEGKGREEAKPKLINFLPSPPYPNNKGEKKKGKSEREVGERKCEI